MKAVRERYEPRGAALELFHRREPEVLYVGPSNSGKTMALLHYCLLLCELYPGVRILWCRETFKSLAQTVLVTWEEEVLPGGRRHECCVGTAHRENRTHYLWPFKKNTVRGKEYEGESEIVLTGLSDPFDWYSAAFDLVIFFEARQVPLLLYQKFLRCLRHKHLPWQQMICDTNPAHERHWLHLRAQKGDMYWLKASHSDNPAFTDEDRARLERLRGSDREELLEGVWSKGTGMVWPQFRYSTHVIRAELKKQGQHWFIHPSYIGQSCGDDPIRIEWTIAGVDWGERKPGSMSVYGIDRDHRVYRLAQYYHRDRTIDWWAARGEELYHEFGIHRFICDHDDGKIHHFNMRISPTMGRTARKIAIKANKEVDAGLSLVRDMLAPDKNGKPCAFFLADTLREKEGELEEDGLPTCTEEEIPVYVFPAKTELDAIRERPDPRCEDHGCDEFRYALMFAFGKDRTPKPPPFEYDPRTYGFTDGDLDNPKNTDDVTRRKGWQAPRRAP